MTMEQQNAKNVFTLASIVLQLLYVYPVLTLVADQVFLIVPVLKVIMMIQLNVNVN